MVMSTSFSPARGDLARSKETWVLFGSKMLKEWSWLATVFVSWMIVERVCWGSVGLWRGSVTDFKNDGRV
jgi:hypothetical protein